MSFYAIYSCCKRLSFSSLKTIPRIILRGAKRSSKAPRQPIITAKNPFTTETVLYLNESNPRFYHIVGVISVLQLGVWANWAHLAFTYARDTTEEGAPRTRLRTRLIICGMYMGCGIFVLTAGWFYCLRNIQRILLQKGGTGVIVSTYKPWGGMQHYPIKLHDITCNSGRQAVKGKYMIFNTAHHKMNFLAHRCGIIPNIKLFDETVGRRRILKMTRKLSRDEMY